MQISLRSQMIAGTTALVGATAIAMTPVAPAVSIPSLSMSKSAVALAAFPVNPFESIVGTGLLGAKYLLGSQYATGLGGGLANWGLGYTRGGTPPVALDNNIGDILNTAIHTSVKIPGTDVYAPNITNVGLIPNLLSAPLPVLTQVVNNWINYATIAVGAGAAGLTAAANILWAPVGLTLTVVGDLLAGRPDLIPAAISETVTYVINNAQFAVTALVDGAVLIGSSVAAKAQAVVTNLVATVPFLVASITNDFTALLNTTTSVVGNVTAKLATADFVGAWNAAVTGLLGPTGIPGTLLNLTLGAGAQVGPNPLTQYGPSGRVLFQSTGQAITAGLKATPAPILGGASVSPAAARAGAAPSAAAAVTAAPASEAGAGNNSAAAESTTSLPAASVVAVSTDSAVEKASTKAGAARGARG